MHKWCNSGAFVAKVNYIFVKVWFKYDGYIDRGAEQVVFGRSAQRLAEIGRIIVAEAGVQRAGAGDPHAVARLAEIVGHWRDEAELAAGFADTDIAGRASGVLVGVDQRILLGEPRAQQRERYVLIDTA